MLARSRAPSRIGISASRSRIMGAGLGRARGPGCDGAAARSFGSWEVSRARLLTVLPARSPTLSLAHGLVGEPASTPDQVRGRLWPEHALRKSLDISEEPTSEM